MADLRRVLLIASKGCCEGVRSRLRKIGVDLLRVHDCRRARLLLETGPSVDAVITTVTLPDGNWCEIHRHLVESGSNASLVVTTPEADETLWSEIIWRGAYDLLVEPYEEGELERCIEGAIRSADARTASTARAAGV